MKTLKSGSVHLGIAALVATVTLSLAGCGMGTTGTDAATFNPGFSGTVFGGRQPISGATVSVWAAGAGGYGTGASATPLSTTTTATDSTGSFTMPAYSCTNVTTPLYITSKGGNPGNPANANPDVVLVAALGSCGGAQALTGVTINEVSTVAAAFAFSGFINPANFGTSTNVGVADAIGSSSTNATGLLNAFTTYATLATLGGATPGNVSSATVDSAKINTMANVLGACTNTDPTGGSTTCSTLFGNVTPAGSTTAANTFEAAYYLCANPTSTNASGSNITAVYNTAVAGSPFNPALSAVPNDWTVGVNYAVTGMTASQRIAIDASGDAWVTSSGQISEVSPGGGVISFTGAQSTTPAVSINSPYGVAVDLNGNVLVVDSGANDVLQYTASTAMYTSAITGATLAGLAPYAVAFDGTNNAFISYASSNYSTLNQTIGAVTPCAYATSAFCATLGSGNSGGEGIFSLALDKNSAVFAPLRFQNAAAVASGASAKAGSIRYFSNSLATQNNVAYGTASPVKAFFPAGAVFDATGNLWLSNSSYLVSGATTYGTAPSSCTGLTCSFLTQIPVTYAATPTTTTVDTPAAATAATIHTYTGGGLNVSAFLAIDGNSNLWVANSGGYTPGSTTTYSVSEFSNSGTAVSPANYGFVHTMNAPNDIAVDASGNVWVANGGAVNYVTEIVGAAAPTVVPTVRNTKNGTWGTKP